MRQNTPMAKGRLPRHVLRCVTEPMPTRSWNWLPHKIPASTSLSKWRCGDTVSGPFVGSTGYPLTRSTGWSILTANQRPPVSITWSLVTDLLWCLCTSSCFGANEKKVHIRIDYHGVKMIWFFCHIGILHVDSHAPRPFNKQWKACLLWRNYIFLQRWTQTGKLHFI